MLHDHGNNGNNGFTLPYKVADLIKKVAANRKAHHITYEEAVIGFREEFKELLAKKCAEFETSERCDFESSLHLTPPTSYLPEYDRALDMLKMTTVKSITLTPDLFRQLVRDEWSWSSEFTTNSVRYVKVKAKGKV